MEYMKDLIDAKYHLSVTERMYKSYFDFEEKRFLVGVINELAKASTCIVRAYLLFEGVRGDGSKRNLRMFMGKVGPKYLEGEDVMNIFKSLEIEKAQKTSPVEFARGNKIILLVSGKYRFLTSERLSEFINSVKTAILKFPSM